MCEEHKDETVSFTEGLVSLESVLNTVLGW